MNCIFPPELNDQQLMAYLDDPAANQETGRHLQGCPHCQEKATALDRFQKRLQSRVYRSTCPSTEEIGEYYLHMGSASQRLVIAQHLRECPHCAEEMVTLEEFIRDIAPHSGLLEPIKVLMTRLANGSGQSIPMLRGGGNGPLQFEVDGIVIVLDIQPAGQGRMNILGQVAAEDQDQWTGALVELRKDTDLQYSTQVDDLGAFRFDGISPGSKELRITPENKSVMVISKFEISA